MRNSRLIGGKPKIGIRPIIDGRRGGIRESLEDMTMAMAHKVAELYSSVLRHSDGTSVECVIADTTIGGVAEAAMAAEKFRNSGVGVVLSVTPCWCYGFETIDMDGEMPKAIWGFNGTERPGAVYLASALASHTQKGLPTFGIYGRDVQEVTNMEIPEDVQEKLLRFARAGIAVATMKGKSYLSIGSVSMGIAGSIPNPDFFQEYLGMRNEYVDASEIERRVQLGIYDHEEFARAMAWTEKYCKSNEGTDFNPEHLVYSREEKDARWEYVVKMTLIFRDMMIGNPKLAEMGFKEESMGHNAIAAGFQGQRQWTDYKPDGDFSYEEKTPCVSVNFIFSNKGKTPLVIYDVKASCGCTVPTWPKAPIKPDGKSLIKVDFETKKQKGVFTKTIFVESNANEDVILLKLKGKVE